jgi:hypothetical protein
MKERQRAESEKPTATRRVPESQALGAKVWGTLGLAAFTLVSEGLRVSAPESCMRAATVVAVCSLYPLLELKPRITIAGKFWGCQVKAQSDKSLTWVPRTLNLWLPKPGAISPWFSKLGVVSPWVCQSRPYALVTQELRIASARRAYAHLPIIPMNCYRKNSTDKYLSSHIPSCTKRIQARCKDVVKVTVNFIRKGYTSNRLKVRYL